MPSHASLRLWEDSVEALVGDSREQARSRISYSDKARLLAGEALRYHESPESLVCAYVLEWKDSEGIQISPVTDSDRHMAWVSNSFLLDIRDKDLLAQHFDWTHRISGQVPTFRLDYPRDYGMLADVRDAIVAHSAGIAS